MLDEPRSQRSSHHPKQRDPAKHQPDTRNATRTRDRIPIPIPDRGDGRHSPPRGITEVLDARRRLRPLRVQDRNRRSEPEEADATNHINHRATTQRARGPPVQPAQRSYDPQRPQRPKERQRQHQQINHMLPKKPHPPPSKPQPQQKVAGKHGPDHNRRHRAGSPQRPRHPRLKNPGVRRQKQDGDPRQRPLDHPLIPLSERVLPITPPHRHNRSPSTVCYEGRTSPTHRAQPREPRAQASRPGQPPQPSLPANPATGAELPGQPSHGSRAERRRKGVRVAEPPLAASGAQPHNTTKARRSAQELRDTPRLSRSWRVQGSNLRRHTPTDLQSAPFGRSGNPPGCCRFVNRRGRRYNR